MTHCQAFTLLQVIAEILSLSLPQAVIIIGFLQTAEVQMRRKERNTDDKCLKFGTERVKVNNLLDFFLRFCRRGQLLHRGN